MRFELLWLNCFWLMLPLLAWNLVLGTRIKDRRITSDEASPKWLLMGENVSRIIIFALSLLLPIKLKDAVSQSGLWIYILGTLIYFASWLPYLIQPKPSWSDKAAGLLAPRVTPYLSFLGIALIGHNWIYGLLAALFIGLHTAHGVQNIRRYAVKDPGSVKY